MSAELANPLLLIGYDSYRHVGGRIGAGDGDDISSMGVSSGLPTLFQSSRLCSRCRLELCGPIQLFSTVRIIFAISEVHNAWKNLYLNLLWSIPYSTLGGTAFRSRQRQWYLLYYCFINQSTASKD